MMKLIASTKKKNSWLDDIKKQRLIFSIVVNGIIISAAYINIRYLRFIYTDQNDLDAQLYLSFSFLFMTVYCYFKASLTSPVQSDVDKYFNFSLGNTSKGNSIINIDASRYKSKCEFCDKFKFERTSHCRVCNICVLRRDHHCVWIGNCVGLNNNQYFFNFCTWVVVSKINFKILLFNL
jgi:palmitoyltransferase ZDHHC2/15/20